MATLLPNALCTVEDVKETLGIPSSNHTKDNLIIRKINAATEIIEKYTGSKFQAVTYTDEEYDATNSDQLILKHTPIIDFTSLSVRSNTLNIDDWEIIDSDLYFVDAGAGVLDLVFHAVGSWNRYKATYSAGYATVPSDVIEACVTIAVYLAENPTGAGAIRTKQEGGRRIEYYSTGSSKDGGSGNLFTQLGLVDILSPYCDYPILADK